MIDLLLFAFVGKWFYELAKKFKKPRKWGYIVLGIFSYIIVGYSSVFTIFLLTIYGEQVSGFAIGLLPSFLAIPFGILGVWLLYLFLERKWSREQENTNELLDESLDPQNKNQ